MSIGKKLIKSNFNILKLYFFPISLCYGGFLLIYINISADGQPIALVQECGGPRPVHKISHGSKKQLKKIDFYLIGI